MDGESELGPRLQTFRQAAGLTQQALASAADVPLTTLRNWEHGRREPLLGAAARLAKALGVTLDQLAGIEDKPAAKAKRKPRK